jgi:hypothetical protein
MSKKGPAHEYKSFEVITQEDPETGDIIIPLPPILLEQLGWAEGDDITFSIDDKGHVILSKKSK